ncbi:hypothetical protein QBC34DRAFT_413177 [Podospora aff. communis PSN243]|uniref:F-box domain-containing protein n=1 Tax=Podospora aff. communis PSN243 TaxID=3040156 RepID=A0AAV9GDG3_9PEZI|nr:hypothetical protein QBC34DRAFT_413177 [Podospora aff. communis PSN243]
MTTPQRLLAVPPNPQIDSPLFNRIPPEIRHQIFTLALSSFPDPAPTTQYSTKTYYTRPSYFAPYKSDTRLLRTCRAVYAEAWHLPFLLREQIHWLTTGDRAPPEYSFYTSRTKLREGLRLVGQSLGDALKEGEEVEIERLRMFAQMWAVERGDVSDVLRMAGLHPRVVVLTIRHADWWWWEHDHPLRFESGWVEDVWKTLSPSVREFRIELESLDRKKDQIDRIAKQMTEKWYFIRTDGVTLFPDVTGKSTVIDRWTGTSEFDGKVWTRDESRPGEIDYYMATVVFRPEWVVRRFGGQVDSELTERAKKGEWDSAACQLMGVVVQPGDAENWDSANFSDEGEEDEEEEEEDGEEEEDWEEDEDGDGGEDVEHHDGPEGGLEGIPGNITSLA